VALWEKNVRALPIARTLDKPILIDHIPDVLDRIAHAAAYAHSDAEERALPHELADAHAIARLNEGFDLSQVVLEFSILRDAITSLWEEESLARSVLSDLKILNHAIDRAVSASIRRYTEVRDRTTRALDRLAIVALESGDLDDLLRRLLAVMLESTPAVDTGAIFLRDGDALRLRASVGLEDDVVRNFTIAVGEGIAGTIAQTKQPMFVREAFQDPRLKSDVLRTRGVRALYGVPLVENGAVIGVAKMGSLTAQEFSQQDVALFSTMASRATAAIHHHLLREEAERTAHQLAIDIAERRLLEDKLRESEERFRTIADEQRFLSDASKVLSASLGSNDTLEQLARLAVPALADWCAIDLVDGERIDRVVVTHADPSKAALAQRFKEQGPPTNVKGGIAQVMRTGVSELCSEVTADLVAAGLAHEHVRLLAQLGLCSYIIVPLVARGRVLGALSVVSAESGRRFTARDQALLEEIGRRAGIAVDNARLYADAQTAVRLREEVLAVVSHDLKNPLSTIQMTAALMQQHPDGDVARTIKHAERLQRAVSRMDHLVADLLDMARVQTGHMKVEQTPHDVRALISEMIEQHELLAKERGITIVDACAIPEGTRVSCDRERMQQVFANILGNALKFGRPGDTITISGELTGSGTGALVRFSIADTGPGIASDELPHVFDPYWSALRYRKRGTGLGLYICKGIVEAHGGTISADSAEGRGTTFQFTLPIA
jgi:signal transduction histidine kinase